MIPFPVPLPKTSKIEDALYHRAYFNCLAAQWQLASDPIKNWRGTIMTPAQAFADDLIEGAEGLLTQRAAMRAAAKGA